ncbi:MAG: hypothetical protein ACR2NX_12060 [Chthoniobacterales bacterium]
MVVLFFDHRYTPRDLARDSFNPDLQLASMNFRHDAAFIPKGYASIMAEIRILLFFHFRAAATGRRIVAGFFCRSAFGYLDLAAAIGLRAFISCTFF